MTSPPPGGPMQGLGPPGGNEMRVPPIAVCGLACMAMVSA
jgi:hypothetical protein